jgi:hypothetical protein
METLTVHALPFKTRPPCLAPRKREIDLAVERNLRSWLFMAFGLRADALCDIIEWRAADSRTIPHTVTFTFDLPFGRCSLTVNKASERIAAVDLDEHLAEWRRHQTTTSPPIEPQGSKRVGVESRTMHGLG